jgi:hypothetical protein
MESVIDGATSMARAFLLAGAAGLGGASPANAE